MVAKQLAAKNVWCKGPTFMYKHAVLNFPLECAVNEDCDEGKVCGASFCLARKTLLAGKDMLMNGTRGKGDILKKKHSTEAKMLRLFRFCAWILEF